MTPTKIPPTLKRLLDALHESAEKGAWAHRLIMAGACDGIGWE